MLLDVCVSTRAYTFRFHFDGFVLAIQFAPVCHDLATCGIQGSSGRTRGVALDTGIQPQRSDQSPRKMLKSSLFRIGTSLLIIPTFLLCKHCSLCEAEHNFSPKIAVIGAGIGGSTAAHFSRRLFGPAATIDVFEALPRLGGRLATVEIDGKSYEAGGSVIHPSNQHMDTFVKELGKQTLQSRCFFYATCLICRTEGT